MAAADAFRPGFWRVLALDVGAQDDQGLDPAGTEPDAAAGAASPPGTRLVWNLPGTYVLRMEDRVVLAATRRGLAELMRRQGPERTRR